MAMRRRPAQGQGGIELAPPDRHYRRELLRPGRHYRRELHQRSIPCFRALTSQPPNGMSRRGHESSTTLKTGNPGESLLPESEVHTERHSPESPAPRERAETPRRGCARTTESQLPGSALRPPRQGGAETTETLYKRRLKGVHMVDRLVNPLLNQLTPWTSY